MNAIFRFLSVVVGLTHATLVRNLRLPVPLIVTFIQDVVFSLACGYGARGVGSLLSFEIDSFAAIGTLTLQTLVGAAANAQLMMRDPEIAPMAYMRRTAVHPAALACGVISAQSGVRMISNVMALAVLRLAMLHGSPRAMLTVAAALWLVGVVGAAYGTFFSSLIPEPRIALMFVFFFFMIQFYVCGGIVPAPHASGVGRVVRSLLPFEFSVDLVRRAYFATAAHRPPFDESTPRDLVAMFAMTFLLWLFAMSRLRRASAW